MKNSVKIKKIKTYISLLTSTSGAIIGGTLGTAIGFIILGPIGGACSFLIGFTAGAAATSNIISQNKQEDGKKNER